MQPYMTLSADVLIVGGGSAGVMAAIRAKQMDPGQRVVVFEKGDMQYSGCIARGMDAMNIVAVPGTEETPELYVETNREACQGIMDEPVNYAMAKRTWAVMKELMDWGVCFPVDEKGQFDKLQIHSKGKFCITMKEPELKTILAKKAYESVFGNSFINNETFQQYACHGYLSHGLRHIKASLVIPHKTPPENIHRFSNTFLSIPHLLFYRHYSLLFQLY